MGNNQITAASLAGIGAVSSGLITFLNPLKESEKRWLAWKLLDGECLEFELSSNSSKDLIETDFLSLARIVRIGENIIGGSIIGKAIQKFLEPEIEQPKQLIDDVES